MNASAFTLRAAFGIRSRSARLPAHVAVLAEIILRFAHDMRIGFGLEECATAHSSVEDFAGWSGGFLAGHAWETDFGSSAKPAFDHPLSLGLRLYHGNSAYSSLEFPWRREIGLSHAPQGIRQPQGRSAPPVAPGRRSKVRPAMPSLFRDCFRLKIGHSFLFQKQDHLVGVKPQHLAPDHGVRIAVPLLGIRQHPLPLSVLLAPESGGDKIIPVLDFVAVGPVGIVVPGLRGHHGPATARFGFLKMIQDLGLAQGLSALALSDKRVDDHFLLVAEEPQLIGIGRTVEQITFIRITENRCQRQLSLEDFPDVFLGSPQPVLGVGVRRTPQPERQKNTANDQDGFRFHRT